MKTNLNAQIVNEMVADRGIYSSSQVELPGNRFAVVFSSETISDNGFLIIGKIQNGITTFGSLTDFSSEPITYCAVTKIDYDTLCIAYNTATESRVKLITLNDTEIDEVVDNSVFNTSPVTNINIVSLTSSKVFITFNISNYGRAIIGDIEEDTITFGSTYSFIDDDIGYVQTLKINDNKSCISFQADNKGQTVIAHITNNVISFSSCQIYNETTTYAPTISLLSNGQMCLAYSDPFPSSHIEIMLGDINTNDITWGTSKAIYDGADVTGMNLVSFPDERVTLSIADDAGVHYGSIMLLHRRVDGKLIIDDTKVIHNNDLYNINAININDTYCNVVYSGYVLNFTGKSYAFEVKRLKELSKLYDDRSNLRGKASEGFVRPTLKQFFTSYIYEEEEK